MRGERKVAGALTLLNASLVSAALVAGSMQEDRGTVIFSDISASNVKSAMLFDLNTNRVFPMEIGDLPFTMRPDITANGCSFFVVDYPYTLISESNTQRLVVQQLVTREGSTGDFDLFVFDNRYGSTINITEGQVGDQINPNISEDGKKVVYVSSNSSGRWEIRLYDLDTATDSVLTESDNPYAVPRFSPDGNKILFMDDYYNGHNSIKVADLEENTLETVNRGISRSRNPRWIDNQNIVFITDGLVGSNILRVGLNTHEVAEIYHSSNRIATLEWSQSCDE